MLLAAGGTGGHVYPAIAVAEVLLSRRVRVAFAGTRERMEWGAATAAGFPIHALPAVALRRPLLSWVNLLLPFRCGKPPGNQLYKGAAATVARAIELMS